MRTAEERDPDIDLGLFVQGLLDRPSRPFLRDVELEGGGGGGTAGDPWLAVLQTESHDFGSILLES